ncbi:MAG: prepilin-type N-terminal cleavage/methylation domain-containing protein [Opitutae bacterium]|nr:prepilin-type N-terminal cleavage/methylation domain-containing protein [Opitutae bacterium]
MRTRRPPARAGYSLVEVLVTMTVMGLVMAGALPFFISNLRYQYVGEQKLLVNQDVRRATNELVENAREANNFALYQSFYNQSRANGTSVSRDANASGAVTWADRQLNGQAGDMLVFVYYTDSYFDTRFYDGVAGNSPDLSQGRVSRLVIYWTAPNRNISGETALYCLDTDRYKGAGATWNTGWGATLPAALSTTGVSGTTTIEALLPPANSTWAQSTDARIVLNDLNGLANTGACFVNFQNRSVIVRAKILHGSRAKRVTNTYNFTVTPRG